MARALIDLFTAIGSAVPWRTVRRTLTGQGSRTSRRWVLAVGWGLAALAVIAAVRPPTTTEPSTDPMVQAHQLLNTDATVVLVPVRLADQFAASWLRVGDRIDLYAVTASLTASPLDAEVATASPLAIDARVATFLTQGTASGLFSASSAGSGTAIVVAVRSDRASALARSSGRPLGVVLRR